MTGDSIREKQDIETHWDWAASGYQDRELDYDTLEYGSGITEERLGLLDDIEDKQILEVGCGGAEVSITLAKRGANCTGVDISREQLSIAQARIDEHGVDVDLVKGDIENLGIASGTQDIAISVHAFQWAQNMQDVFQEAFRVLKDDGVLVFSTTNPYFHCLSDEEGGLGVDHPYYQNKVEGKGPNEGLILNHPRISDNSNWLIETGFTIERIEEPEPMDESPPENPGNWYDEGLSAVLPPLVVYKARK